MKLINVKQVVVADPTGSKLTKDLWVNVDQIIEIVPDGQQSTYPGISEVTYCYGSERKTVTSSLSASQLVTLIGSIS